MAHVSLPIGLAGSVGPLQEGYGLLLVDLDGVVYLGDEPIDGAAAALTAARVAGARPAFVTNNAARPPQQVADQLVAMGVAATANEVMTSAVAAANELAGRLPGGSAVLVVGGDGITLALRAVGLVPVRSADEQPAAVLQGFAPDVGWRSLAEAAVAIRNGATWIATNTDLTLPSPRGPLPGNGSLVAALAAATGLEPEVIGKPGPALYHAAQALVPGVRTLAVGDRLDTDIAGARAAVLRSLLVLTGVSTASDVLTASPGERPDYIGRDLGALGLAHAATECDGTTARCGTATAIRDVDTVRVDPGTATGGDRLDPVRAVIALAWASAGNAAMSDGQARPFQTALGSLDVN